MQTNFIYSALAIATVAGLEIATSECEESIKLTPSELQQMIDNGLTEDALSFISSVQKVYLEIAEPDESINSLINLQDEEEPETIVIDLAALKT